MVRKNPNRYEWKMPLELLFLGQSREQPQLTRILHYSYRLDGVKLSGVECKKNKIPFPSASIFWISDSSSLSSSNSSHFNPTANWNDSLSEPTTTTINDYSFQSSGTQGSSHGIFEDHPGLHPSSERIIELQSDIHERGS